MFCKPEMVFLETLKHLLAIIVFKIFNLNVLSLKVKCFYSSLPKLPNYLRWSVQYLARILFWPDSCQSINGKNNSLARKVLGPIIWVIEIFEDRWSISTQVELMLTYLDGVSARSRGYWGTNGFLCWSFLIVVKHGWA